MPVAARWVIERSNAWVERCKSLVKNFDRTLDRSNAKLELLFYSADAQAASCRHLKRSQMGSIKTAWISIKKNWNPLLRPTKLQL